MATISFIRKHSLGSAEAKRRILPAIAKTAAAFGLNIRWEEDICHFAGPASGRLTVRADSIELHARLGLLASLMKNDIAKEIAHELDNALA
jgi:putative polyhydroxyalkanoate system protein